MARGIPYRRLTEGSLVQFGWGSQAAPHPGRRGRPHQRGGRGHCPGQGPDQDACCPPPACRCPWAARSSDVDDAWAAAQEIGLPVVVKPQDGNQGKGVTVNIVTEDQLEVAYRAAAEIGTVMVERYLPGHDFRLLVVGDKLVAAARREPPLVIGDGTAHRARTGRQGQQRPPPRRWPRHLADQDPLRRDRRRPPGQAGPRRRIRAAKGERVILRNNANLSTGGTATDVTDDVHPEVAARAIAAAQIVGLDICGVDVVCENVLEPARSPERRHRRSQRRPRPAHAPGSPRYGKGRNVGEAMVDNMFKPGDDGRIPVVAVAGTNGKTTTVPPDRAPARRPAACASGMTNTDGVYVQAAARSTAATAPAPAAPATC